MNHHSCYADLHLHTNHSDGYYSPRDLVDKVRSLGLKAAAITDHDEISGLPDAIQYGEKCGLELLAGVELSVHFHGKDIHILGYGFDPVDKALVEYLAGLRNNRIERARKTVDKLTDLGLYISFDEVIEVAGSGSVGRPHVANVLLKYGLVSSFKEAFDKYLGDGKPANVRKRSVKIEEALQIIETAGGVCSIAHPGIQIDEAELMALIKAGCSALEVVHPKHNEVDMQYYRKVAGEHGLLETGGSDFHGGPKGEEAIGKYTVPCEVVEHIKSSSQYHQSRIQAS